MTELTERDLSFKVYDALSQLLAHARIRCELLEGRIKRLENSKPVFPLVITSDLNEAIDMALCAWSQGSHVYEAKYGERKWGTALRSAFLKATDPEGNHE